MGVGTSDGSLEVSEEPYLRDGLQSGQIKERPKRI